MYSNVFKNNAQDLPYKIPFIIAEIGINHNGDVEIAKQLIDMACACGCDAVKFQKRTIDIVYTKEFLDSYRESPWGTTQRAQKEGLEFGRQEYDNINFLRRHWLMPGKDDQVRIEKYALKNIQLKGSEKALLHDHARYWRALYLPTDPRQASQFIYWCMREEIFLKMMRCTLDKGEGYELQNELGDDGVGKIWIKIAQHLK